MSYQSILIGRNEVYLQLYFLMQAGVGAPDIFELRLCLRVNVHFGVLANTSGAKSNKAVLYVWGGVLSAQKLLMSS